ncbi:hypothetical protein DL770_008562 [Monosporascus sp. CRB-9-2]|nr:hypothetical protein DL770_008562 [Monosporascus sp. CRB-9-2]
MMAKRSRDKEDNSEGAKRNKTKYETNDDNLIFKGPAFHNVEVGAQTDNTPRTKANTPQTDDATQTDNTLTHGGLIDKHIIKFWEKKIRKNSKRKFEITWSELIEVCPDFGKAFKNFMAAKTLEALGRRNTETIKITEAKVRRSKPLKVRKPPKILTMDIGYKAESQKKARVLSVQQCSPAKYITPLFRLAVRMGHGSGEDLINGIIDTGAKFSVIVASYVKRHGLAIRQTRVSFMGFNSQKRTPFEGIVEAPVWLAGRLITIPLFVVNNHYAAQPLILGLNFMAKSKMTLNMDPDVMEGTLEFGPSKIIIPLVPAERVTRSIRTDKEPEKKQPVKQ